jgi:cation transport protein ChaC
MSELWVFGYGSLIWRPGFPFLEAVPARLIGFHRSLCVYSYVHRGTPESPGLVLGLDRGGSCLGRAFRVDPLHRDETIAYLREREQATAVYLERRLPVTLLDGSQRRLEALAYVADRRHEQYAGRLAHERQIELVRRGVGRSGVNRDYVLSTVAALADLGISDLSLARLAGALADAGPAPPAGERGASPPAP